MILCQKLIPLVCDDNGRMRSNTYCMRETGHTGKCNIFNREPPEPKKEGAKP